MNDLRSGVDWIFDSGNWWGGDGLIGRIGEHMWYSVIALTIAIVIALPIGLVIGHTGRGRFVAVSTGNLLRAIPTFGVVALLFIWKPLTLWPLLLALAVLAIPPIMINTAAGIAGVDPQTRDAAEGVGLTGPQVLARVEIPSAIPLILAGVRSASNQVIATATVLGFKGQGGLGRYIFSGYSTQRYFIVYGASIVVIVLVLSVEGAFAIAQRRLISPGLRMVPAGKRNRTEKLITLVGNTSIKGRTT
jgi:osmoprotectant transport system permease protein